MGPGRRSVVTTVKLNPNTVEIGSSSVTMFSNGLVEMGIGGTVSPNEYRIR